jgi:adenylosuccinate lyase
MWSFKELFYRFFELSICGQMKGKVLPSKRQLLKRLRSASPNYSSISPGEYRYKVPELLPYLSEEALVWYEGVVEAAITESYEKIGAAPKGSAFAVARAAENVTAAEVYEEERRTNHNIIALVRRIRSRMAKTKSSYVHMGATSQDVIDTANALRYRDAFTEVILPDCTAFLNEMIKIVRREADTPQIGRSHLQHGEPITFGFSQAWFIDRFGGRLLKMKEASESLVGKFSGAMGSYNAQSLFVKDPIHFEADVLGRLGMQSSDISSQIVQPEYMMDLISACMGAFSVLANWADDMRNLMRPEVGEVWLPRSADISASSTMPHKQNPVGFENIKSLWKQSIGMVTTGYLDMISENARDLTNSASARFRPEFFDLFDYSVKRATRIATRLRVNAHNMRRNLEMGANIIPSEPLQLLLAAAGLDNAHEEVGRLADIAAKDGKNIVALAVDKKELRPYMHRIGKDRLATLLDIHAYTGKSRDKALAIANKWDRNWRL